MNQFIKGLVVGGILVASGFGLASYSQPKPKINPFDATWDYKVPTTSVPTTYLAPAAARFQIYQSVLAARHQFLLDTWSGDTWNCVVDKDNNQTWQKMTKD